MSLQGVVRVRSASAIDRGRGSRHDQTGDQPGGEPIATSVKERVVSTPNATDEERRFLEKHASSLSKSTLRAKWIHAKERPDRNGQTLATRDPDVIRQRADKRKGQPATVARRDGSRPRTLRFDFPSNGPSSRLEPIDWDEWLRTFQERDLVFLFQERRRDGSDSNFFRLDSPRRERG